MVSCVVWFCFLILLTYISFLSFFGLTSVMDFPTLFVCCYHRHDYNPERNGGIYSLITTCGRFEKVAFFESRGSDPLVYYASLCFIAKFGPILSVGGDQEWLYKREMDVWISKMIFFSFLPLIFEIQFL